MVDTTARSIRRRVVKFMVKVKLMEKRVKSHVGRVRVVKVISQYRKPGIAATRYETRLRRPEKMSTAVAGPWVRGGVMEEKAAAVGEASEGEIMVDIKSIVGMEEDCHPIRNTCE
jgi:hypothetical protein